MSKRIIGVAGASFLAMTLSACTNSGMVTGSIDPSPFSQTAGTASIPLAPLTPAVASNATPPAGYIGFCIRFPDQCKSPADAPLQVALQPKTWQLLASTNKSINDAVWPESDQKHYGQSEYWTIVTDGYGDCEDIALTKRKQLIDAGLSGQALRIAVVITPRREVHAVLTVATDQGDYVLDNLRQEILPWDKTGYKWIERQDPSVASGWASLQSASPSVVQIASIPTGALAR